MRQGISRGKKIIRNGDSSFHTISRPGSIPGYYHLDHLHIRRLTNTPDDPYLKLRFTPILQFRGAPRALSKLPELHQPVRTQFIVDRGVRICILDFSHLPDEGSALLAIEEAKRFIAREPKKSVYTLTDVTGSRVTSGIRSALHALTQANAPYVIAGAVVGLTSIQMIILRGIVQMTKRRLVVANSREEARDWIVTEAGRATTT